MDRDNGLAGAATADDGVRAGLPNNGAALAAKNLKEFPARHEHKSIEVDSQVSIVIDERR